MPMLTVTRNGQITIPKKFRDALGIEEGTRVVMNRDENSILIAKRDMDFFRKRKSVLPTEYEEELKRLREQDFKRTR